MARNLSASTITATTAAVVLPVIFVEVVFTSGALRLHTGFGPLTLNGNTFSGTGGLLGVSSVEEDGDLASHSASFRLGGLDPAMLAAFLQEHYQGRQVRAWLAFFNADGSGTLLADPFEFFTGRLDTAGFTDTAESLTISARAESELVDLRRSRELRFTDPIMKVLHPNDRGFEHVEKIQNRTIIWGKYYREGEAGYRKPKDPFLPSKTALLIGGHGIT